MSYSRHYTYLQAELCRLGREQARGPIGKAILMIHETRGNSNWLRFMGVKMMNSKDMVHRGITDGIGRGIVLWMVNEFILSPLSGEDVQMILVRTALFCVAGLVTLSWATHHSLTKCANNKKKVLYYFLSLLTFLLSYACILAVVISFHVNLFPDRASGNADGILILFVDFAFILVSEVVRIIHVLCSLAVNSSV